MEENIVINNHGKYSKMSNKRPPIVPQKVMFTIFLFVKGSSSGTDL